MTARRAKDAAMSAAEFTAAGERLYGPHWRAPLSWALQVDLSTVSRWASGIQPVHAMAALAVENLLARARQQFAEKQE